MRPGNHHHSQHSQARIWRKRKAAGNKLFLIFQSFLHLSYHLCLTNAQAPCLQVGYLTALDVFVLICFFCVFAALLEFAVINFITVTISRQKAEEEKRREALDNLVKSVQEKLTSVSPPKEEVPLDPGSEGEDKVQEGRVN